MNGPMYRLNAARAADGGAVPSPSRAACTRAPPMPPAAAEPTRSNQIRQSARAICRRKTKAKTIAAIPNASGQRLTRTSSLLMFDWAW